ncbi:ribonucleotide reductase [Caulobacter phage CcrPW]|uniref:Ribonucleoside-diphosphate reductase n=1 Tax=Caulobacter phage CcrPW TaxID=2283271 RepID=A0A385EAI5_9CAUD|nr:ribonucleotide reductase [Caulobacter phage CcrPW]AXQ68690.1 ribonucleotide reductase of class Ia (aerobic), alpha subunit [Caulobacter phage CcrPW]
MAVDPHLVTFDLSRDSLFDEFTLQTFRDRYLIDGETSPQHAFARASAAFADDAEHAQRLYDAVSKGWFMFATPLLSNGGTSRGLPISCFLSTAEDSREGIFDHWTETGWLSSVGGGVGGYWPLRSNGTKTSQGSSSTGVIPFIAAVDRIILSVSQGGTRRGSYAAYMDIDHPEVMEFITGRKPTGGDANRKFINLHNALCITDKFMEAVRDDAPFDLVDPKSKQVVATHSAREMWKQIMETRKQTGEPYMFFVDVANRALPEPQKKKGLRVNQSNLCVAPYTELLTKLGHKPIGALVGQEVEVWNGDAWSKVTVEETGKAQELVRVWFEDGSHLDVTPYHKFYAKDGTEIRAGALKVGTILEPAAHPIIEGGHDYSVDVAYTAGYATFAGFEDANRLTVFSPDIPGDAVTKRLMQHSVNASADALAGGFTIRYEPKSIPSGRAPTGWTETARLAWFAGIMDAGGSWVDLGAEGKYLTVTLNDAAMVNQMRLDALEAFLTPRIRITDAGNAFMLDEGDVWWLNQGGMLLKHTGRATTKKTHPVVADVVPIPFKTDTYCVTEPLRHRAVFNGTLTGNCTEITLATGRDDQGKKRTAVCCLSSVNAEKYDEWVDDPHFIEDLMRMLDNCLQVFIEQAPEALAYAIYSATQERSVGLGLLGFHAYLQKHMIRFESHKARKVNRAIFKHIRSLADAASLKLGAERGEAPDMAGTGERFAHKMAIAPNASSSILCGNTSPSIEPWRANAYLHKTLSGSFPVKNPWLVRELAKLGLDTQGVWKAIIANEGSVQGLGTLVKELGKAPYYVFDDLGVEGIEIDAEVWENLMEVFKTFTELDMRWVVQLARDRQEDIDQAQSVNTAFPHDADAGYMSEVHYLAWDPDAEGAPIKSLYYYRSTTPKRAENTNEKIERAKTASVEVEAPPSNGLSANPLDDSTCIACEG